jgi:hypothetical protein
MNRASAREDVTQLFGIEKTYRHAYQSLALAFDALP